MTARKRAWPAVFLLVALTAAAFLPVKDADFVAYDDLDYVVNNPTVLEGLRPAGVRWALTSFHAANWHPLTWISHMADVTLFGPRPGPHHLTSLALHAASAALLMTVLRGMTGVLWPSFLAAALFAVHPLHVESVAWVSERKDVLSGLLAALTLGAYLRYARRPSAGRYLAVAVTLALGLMAKPMLVTLPFVLLLLDWWPLGRFGATLPWDAPGRAAARRLVLEKLPLLGLAAVSGVLTFLAQQSGGAMSDREFFPMSIRLANAPVSYVAYLGKMLWPRDLIYFYPHPLGTLTAAQVGGSVALLAAITALATALARRRPWLFTGWFWYAGMLVPVIGVVQVGRQAMADRYTYLPLTGLFLAIAWEARSRASGSPRARAALGALAAALLAVLAAMTFRQAAVWHDTQTLSTHLLSIDPRNYVAYNLRGMDLLLRGQAREAVPLLRSSVALDPGYLEARYNLGLALTKIGENDEALAQFAQVVKAAPRDAEALFNLGLQYAMRGDFADALALFNRALAENPDNATLRHHAGRTLGALGRREEAIAHLRAAVRLDPRSAATHNELGVTLAESGRMSEAVGHFREAVRLDPQFEEARANLERAREALAAP